MIDYDDYSAAVWADKWEEAIRQYALWSGDGCAVIPLHEKDYPGAAELDTLRRSRGIPAEGYTTHYRWNLRAVDYLLNLHVVKRELTSKG